MPLHKALNFFTLTMYGIGIIVGAGIYALIGQAAGIAGNGVWLSFVVGAVLASFTGLSYAELSSAYPNASAEADYLKHAFGKDLLAFLAGWLVVVTGFLAASTVSLGFAEYFSTLIALPIPLIAIALIVILSVVDFFGIEISSKVNIFFTLISLFGIFLIIFLGIPFLGKTDYFEFSSSGISGIFNATSLIFFAYIGFEAIVKLGEETKHARQIMPKALIASIAIVAVLYILLSITAISIVPAEELSKSQAPLAEIATRANGAGLGFVFTILALCAMLSTVLVSIIVTTRLLYGLGEKHELPKILSKVYKKSGAPYVAIIITMLGASTMVLLGNISFVAKATTFLVFLVFFGVNASLIVLRLKQKNFFPKFRVPLNIGNFPIIALLGAVSSVAMLFNYSLVELGITIVFVAIGFAIYFIENELPSFRKQKAGKKRKWGYKEIA